MIVGTQQQAKSHHLPSSRLMYNHLRFGRCILIDLFTQGARFHVAIRFCNMHRTITTANWKKIAKRKSIFPFVRRCSQWMICCVFLPLMIFTAGQWAPLLWAFKPCWKITSFGWRRSTKRHYTWSNLDERTDEQIYRWFDSVTSIQTFTWLVHTSALSRPLHVASPDWASLYSASFDVSSGIEWIEWTVWNENVLSAKFILNLNSLTIW